MAKSHKDEKKKRKRQHRDQSPPAVTETANTQSQAREGADNPTEPPMRSNEPEADEPRQDSPNQIRSPPLVHDLSNDQEVDRAFEALYLQQMTAEFADDLDALRRADDFTEESLPILLTALKQGTDLFSLDEKRAVVAATNRKKT